MEGRIRQLDSILNNCEIVEAGGRRASSAPGPWSSPSSTTATATTTPRRYLIGHIEERDDELDVISPGSPLGEALTGHRAGDTVHYEAPTGTLGVKIVNVAAPLVDRCRDRGDASPPLPPGREVELPGRGTTFVRELPGPPGAPTRRAAARLDGDGRRHLVPHLRAAGRALPRARPRPPRPRPGHPAARAVPARGLRRRRRRAGGAARASPASCRSATRWAGRWRCCCGSATAPLVERPRAVRDGPELPQHPPGPAAASSPWPGWPRPTGSRRHRPGRGWATGSSPAAAASTRTGPSRRSCATTGAPCSRPAPPSGGSRRGEWIGVGRLPDGGDHR